MKATHGASPADEAKDMTIQFRTNARKALEVILWFAQRGRTDFHGILKLLFFADKHHLNAYGRPIIGDQYKALPYGPVAQTTYDILKGDALAREQLGMPQLPFRIVDGYAVKPTRDPDLQKLSESDIEALEWAWEKYGRYSFDRLTRVSHEDPAYANAEGQAMRYEDFIEPGDDRQERIDDLRAEARRLVL